MTWQTTLYFSSILITIVGTAFLAWYAWRQRGTLGARTYLGLVLSECALALAELLSMLSGTQAQALFWFKIRFLPTSIMAVFLLLFALEYSGRKGWFSKRLLVGLSIIPVITQVVIWNNSLYGLWVRQEVGFHQNDSFWIAETSARLPGVWFLVYSFYNLLLLLVGIGLMLVTAWRMRRETRGQAFLLVAGALVALVVALIPTFNLNPQAQFNPFTPAIGFSALLYALAIFRFQFLKHKPEVEGAGSASRLDTQEKRSLALFLLVFILMLSAIATAGYLSYQNYQKQFRSQVESQLAAVASLKVEQLEEWRSDLLADASFFYRNANFSGLVRRYLDVPDDTEAKNSLAIWLERIRAHPEYDRVFLLDVQGRELFSVPAAPEPFNAYVAEQVTSTLASGQVTMLDFHRDTSTGPIHLSIFVPIYDELEGNRPLGVLVLRIDPYEDLYPFIQRWPVPSASAETLIVRRDGQDALFLNELRFNPNSALELRIPLQNTENLAVKAVLGQGGVVQGRDYRGVAAIGYVGSVPGSPWFLVARIDTAEVYAPLRERLWQTVIFFVLLITSAGAGLLLTWRQQRLRLYREQVATAETLVAERSLLRTLIDHLPDMIYVKDAAYRKTLANPADVRQMGASSEAEVLGKTDFDFYPPELAAAFYADDQSVIQSGQPILNREEMITLPDRTIGWQVTSKVPLRDSAGQVIGLVGIGHDITERQRAEKLQEAIYRIAQAADHAESLDSLYPSIHAIIQEVMVADNFYIALYDEKNDLLSFPYSVDEVEPPAAPEKPGKGMTEYVLRTAKSLLCDDARFEEMKQRGEAELVGAHSPIWLGVPLIIAGQAIGVMAVQDYKDARAYGEREQRILEFVSSQVAKAIYRKRTEEELKKSEGKFRTIFDNASDGMFIVDLKTRKFFMCNTTCAKMLGYAQDEFLNLNIADIHPGEDLPFIYEQIGKFSRGEDGIRSDIKFKRKNGSIFASDLSPALLTIGEKEYLLINFEDITERKQAEAALRESEERYRRLVETLPDGVIVHSQGRIVFANPASAKIGGATSPAELIGKPVMEFVHPDYREPVLKRIQQSLSEGVPAPLMEEKFIRLDGTPVDVEVANIPFSYAGKPAVLTVVNDITERKQAEEILKSYSEHLKTEVDQRTHELREAQEQLLRQERLAVLGQLAGSIGHELRNPLGVIMSSIYFLKLALPDANDKVKEHLSIIHDEARTSGKIITDLLDFARHTSVESESVSVSELVRLTLERFPAPVAVEVTLELPVDLPSVYVDPRQITQVLGNLVVNACQAMPEGGKLTISATAHRDGIAIEVQDTGVGIPPDNMRKLFEPLFTTKVKGIGLGLPVSKKLAEANGGRIEVQSELGKGSVFTLYLPVVK